MPCFYGEKTATPLKVALIGFGAIALRHLEVIRGLRSDSKFHILSARDPSNVSVKQQFTLHKTVASLLKYEFDMVVIASAASEHLNHFEKFIDKDIPIFVEKPLAASARDAKRMQSLSKDAEIDPVVGYNIRFSSAFREVQKIIQNNKLGKLLSVHAVVGQNLQTWRPGRDLNDTVSVSRAKGGGVLRELSHEFDYLSTLFGEIVDGYALLEKTKYVNFDVEDTAMIILRFKHRSYNLPVSLNMDFTRHDTTRSCHIIGDEATLKWDAVLGHVSVHHSTGHIEDIYNNTFDLAMSYENMWGEFINQDFSNFASITSATKLISWMECLEKSFGLPEK